MGYKVHLNAEENVKKSFKQKKRHPRFEGEPACEYRRGGVSAQGRPRVARVVLLVALLSALTLVSFLCMVPVRKVRAVRSQVSYDIVRVSRFRFPDQDLPMIADLKVFGAPHLPESGYIKVVFRVPVSLRGHRFSVKVRGEKLLRVPGPSIPPKIIPAVGEDLYQRTVKYRLPRFTRYPATVSIDINRILWRGRWLRASFTVDRR